MITLKSFKKKSLMELIYSKDFSLFLFSPISIHRAISHFNNPNSTENDTLLILAFDGDKLAGYIGILADTVILNGEQIKVGWLSTLYVHPNFRGNKIAQKLLSQACNDYHGYILITEYTKEAESIYTKSNLFNNFSELPGISFHFLSNLSKILPAKNKKWNHIKIGLKCLDFILNIGIYTTRKLLLSTPINYEFSNSLDVESLDFIEKNSLDNFFIRNKDRLKWITSFPWVLENKKKNKKYEFSDFDDKFEFIFIKIFNNKRIDTLIVLSIRNNIAKLQFVYGNEKNSILSDVLMLFIKEYHIFNFISYNTIINTCLNKKIFLFKRKRKRNYLIHKNLNSILDKNINIKPLAGDGDPIFT